MQLRCMRSCLGAREKESPRSNNAQQCPKREKEKPRLMHVVALQFTLYLFWGAALVSERGVLVRKENRSGVRKGLRE